MKTINILKIATRNMISRTGDIAHDNLYVAFSEIGKSASGSVISSKFYLRTTVAWPLCLRHNILRKEQGIFHKSIMIMFLKNEDCVTLGKLWK